MGGIAGQEELHEEGGVGAKSQNVRGRDNEEASLRMAHLLSRGSGLQPPLPA